jgi:hypothetical protein
MTAMRHHLLLLPVVLLTAASSACATVPAVPAAPAASARPAAPRPAATTTSPKPLQPPRPAATKRKPAKKSTRPASSFGDGIHEVGVDIRPGQYKVTVPETLVCYYARLRSNSGAWSAVIASGWWGTGAKLNITIKKSDAYFQSSLCGTWRRVD